ncbi:MAG TPA: hypothetical protein VF541_14680 [Longimicrobium sp.]
MGDGGAGFLHRGPEVRECLPQRLGRVDRLGVRGAGAHPRVGQQVVDQRLHAGGAVHRVGDEAVGLLVQLSVVAPGQELRVAGDHAQRLLQVVRGHVGEALQLGVAALQLGGQRGALGLHPPPLGHVLHAEQHQGAFVQGGLDAARVHDHGAPADAAEVVRDLELLHRHAVVDHLFQHRRQLGDAPAAAGHLVQMHPLGVLGRCVEGLVERAAGGAHAQFSVEHQQGLADGLHDAFEERERTKHGQGKLSRGAGGDLNAARFSGGREREGIPGVRRRYRAIAMCARDVCRNGIESGGWDVISGARTGDGPRGGSRRNGFIP